MAKFVCILKQKGEGCDYTIGCGTTTHTFEASDWNEAFQVVKETYGWDDYEHEDYTVKDIESRFNGEFALESCVIYKIAETMDTLYETYVNNLIRQKTELDGSREKNERRKQYEQLKQEFE